MTATLMVAAIPALLAAGPAAVADADFKARLDAAIALHDGGQYEAAIGAFRDLLASRPDDPKLQCELANSLLAAGKFDDAVSHAERGLGRRGGDPVACSVILGSALDGLGEVGKAEKVFRKAIKKSPNVSLLRFNLGVNLGLQNRVAEAIEEFQESIRLKPTHASSWRALAIAWTQSGFRPQAFSALARFLTLEPTGPRAEPAAKQLRPLLFQGVEDKGVDASGKQQIAIDIDPEAGEKDETTGALNTGMSLVAASRWVEEWKDRPDGEFFAHAFVSVMSIFEETGAKDGKRDAFWRESVLPYFRDARAAGHLEAMAWDIRRSLEGKESTDWLEAHAAQVEKYRAWSSAWKPASVSSSPD
jgi:tetratricopeptide (TPR) repeat protein